MSEGHLSHYGFELMECGNGHDRVVFISRAGDSDSGGWDSVQGGCPACAAIEAMKPEPERFNAETGYKW